MTLLTWDEPGARTFETSVDQGVLYLQDGWGIPWNGLISVEENQNFKAPILSYQDGDAFKAKRNRDAFSARIQAFTFPDEFEDYTGSFGLSYRTHIHDDLDYNRGYKLHVVFDARAKVDVPAYSLDQSVAPFSWSITTTPIKIPRMKATSHISLDSTKTSPEALSAIEDILYGADGTLPRLPTIKELFTIFELGPLFVVTDNGDGTFTVEGPDDMVQMVARNLFKLDSESVIHLGDGHYTVSSL